MGGALESSSIRNQHFADALVALEVVLADGRVVQCSSSQNSDLFFGIRGRYVSVSRTPRPTAAVAYRYRWAGLFYLSCVHNKS